MDRLDELNIADEDRAVAILEPLIERAPRVASRVARHRPFSSAERLSDAIRTELRELNEIEMIQLFRAHPELAPENPLSMTNSSQSEQGRLNLTSRSNKYQARLADLNARYLVKFGFPFITALVLHKDIDSVLAEFETRLARSRDQEIQYAIAQICHVSFSRVAKAFGQESAVTSRDVEMVEQSDREHGNRTE
jgi:2-oxo-4-hydroxy-4-carboxy-5-ureidoimidazoline decarboxylase